MIRFVFDTNTASALMRGDAAVVSRMTAVQPEEIGLPQPVLAELMFGIERLPRSKRRDHYQGQLARIVGTLGRVPWTDDVSSSFGEIKARLEKAGKLIEDFDVAIAAHALSLDAVLVTSNVSHMGRIPKLRIEDWTA